MKLDSIPQEVMDHEALNSLTNDACDLVAIDNVSGAPSTSQRTSTLTGSSQDLVSYKKEYLAGDTSYNIVTAVMQDKGMTLGEAVQWIASYHAEIAGNFLRVREEVLQHTSGIPSWGERIDAQVEKYIDGLGQSRHEGCPTHFLAAIWHSVGQWVRGNVDWSFESGR